MNQWAPREECNKELAGLWTKDLWYIVDSVKANYNITAGTHDKQFFKWAMDVYRDMSLANVMKEAVRTTHIPTPDEYFDHIEMLPPVLPIPGPEQAYQPVRDCFTEVRLNLPQDFIDWYTVGIDCCGYIQPLDYNDAIITTKMEVNNCCGDELEQCLERDRLCNCGGAFAGEPGQNVAWSYYDWGFSPYWKNGQFIGGAYGRTAYRYRGAFTIDWQKKQIVLDRHTRPRNGIVLTYLSNGIGQGNANVEEGTEDCLISGVEAKKLYYEVQTKDPRQKSKVDLGMVQLADKKYHTQLRRVLARKFALTPAIVHDIVLRSIKQTPKR